MCVLHTYLIEKWQKNFDGNIKRNSFCAHLHINTPKV